MLDIVTLYNIYKEYAWREYDLLEKRQNWLYVVNVIFLIALGVVVQEQIHAVESGGALANFQSDKYLSSLLSLSRYVIIAVPIAAVIFNIGMGSMALSTLGTLDGIRIRWRAIKNNNNRGADELPQVVAGFGDLGPKRIGRAATSLPAIFLIVFWIALGVAGYHVLFR